MRWAAGALVVLLSLVGCAHTVSGSARQAARAVEILPTEDDVTAAVGNTLSTFGFRPFIGNVEILPDGYRTEADATPIACIAVTDTATDRLRTCTGPRSRQAELLQLGRRG